MDALLSVFRDPITQKTYTPLLHKPLNNKFPISANECPSTYPPGAFDLQEPYCNATFDLVICWPPTKPGVLIMQSCPPLKGIDTTKYAFRKCDFNGRWLENENLPRAGASNVGWTNYTMCFNPYASDLYNKIKPHMEMISRVTFSTRIMEMVGLCLSLISLIIAIFIFFHFRSLRNDRTKIHRNLFIAMIMQVLIRLIVYSDQYATKSVNLSVQPKHAGQKGIDNTEILCESFYILMEYAKTVLFMWMLVEGYQLHNVIVASVFESKPKMWMFKLVGWGVPLILTGTWAGVYAQVKNKSKCWHLYSFSPYYWILEGPRLAVIIINLAFLLNIIRVLVMKMRDSRSPESQQLKKAVKAAIVLLPLLGITNSLNMIPTPWGQVSFIIWTYGAYFLISFQGFFVSLIYCFCNHEVRQTLKTAWTRRTLNPVVNRGSDANLLSRLSVFGNHLSGQRLSAITITGPLRRLNSAAPRFSFLSPNHSHLLHPYHITNDPGYLSPLTRSVKPFSPTTIATLVEGRAGNQFHPTNQTTRKTPKYLPCHQNTISTTAKDMTPTSEKNIKSTKISTSMDSYEAPPQQQRIAMARSVGKMSHHLFHQRRSTSALRNRQVFFGLNSTHHHGKNNLPQNHLSNTLMISSVYPSQNTSMDTYQKKKMSLISKIKSVPTLQHLWCLAEKRPGKLLNHKPQVIIQTSEKMVELPLNSSQTIQCLPNEAVYLHSNHDNKIDNRTATNHHKGEKNLNFINYSPINNTIPKPTLKTSAILNRVRNLFYLRRQLNTSNDQQLNISASITNIINGLNVNDNKILCNLTNDTVSSNTSDEVNKPKKYSFNKIIHNNENVSNSSAPDRFNCWLNYLNNSAVSFSTNTQTTQLSDDGSKNNFVNFQGAKLIEFAHNKGYYVGESKAYTYYSPKKGKMLTHERSSTQTSNETEETFI